MNLLFRKLFDGIIWSSLVSSDGSSLVFDVRNQDARRLEYFKLNLNDFKLIPIACQKTSWWTMLEGFSDHLVLSEYQDKNDPNNKKFYKIDKGERTEILESEVSRAEIETQHPSKYEPESDYFNTVSDFLNLQLPCACEYMEFGKKIILSYYLRSDNEFDRYLLVLDEGKKVLKERQDTRMKGFASGSFFVLVDKLVFVKNRNEIFIYSI